LQVKLLRVLQDGTFIPVGGTKQRRVDVRILAATNRNLEEMVKKGTFREDLYYRLNVINLQLPPLRERAGDIPLLVDFFLEKYASRSGGRKKSLSAEAMAVLEGYQWPGNIRQLENEVQRALIMSGAEAMIGREHLSLVAPAPLRGTTTVVETDSHLPLKDALDALERKIIISALERCGGNKSEAARQLGISRSNLIAKAASFGIG
jgi:transcriptional regulator with PAS, ATPase and Fis domain